MAVWHYKFTLLPRDGISRVHGCIPEELPGYRAVWEPEECEAEEWPNYWEGFAAPETFSSEIGAILRPGISWSEDALMYGNSADNQIQIWKQSAIGAQLNLRRPNLRLMNEILAFAARHDLLVVSSECGHPLEPRAEKILTDIQASRAYRFCKDPEAYLKGLTDEQPGG